MTARSIYDRLDNSPAPPDPAASHGWPSRRAPRTGTMTAYADAYAAAHAALEAQAGRTARALIKERARVYALRPRELDGIVEGAFGLPPCNLVIFLKLLIATTIDSGLPRWFGFGGEIPAINLRGALLYARYLRAKANQLAKRRAS